MVKKAKKINHSCKKTLSRRRGRNWGKFIRNWGKFIVSTAKRRIRVRIRGRRGVVKATATTKKAASEKRNQSSCIIDRLPSHVLLNCILSTLPVKSILQLRFVCKSLYSLISHTLISDTYFVKTHLNRSITSPNLLRQRQHIWVRINPFPDCSYAFSLEADKVDGDIVASAVKIDYIDIIYGSLKIDYIHMIYRSGSHRIIGSCDGLLCVSFWRVSFCVVNLSTREFKRIPEPEFRLLKDFFIYGFGYDHSVDDYKLVTADDKSFYVYSLRSNSWKKVQALPNKNHWDISSLDGGILLNGAIHWVWVCSDDEQITAIVAFSLADEKFWEFVVPTLCVTELMSHRFGLLGGCLCVVPWGGREFWVMKEYGMTQSWTKVVIEIPSLRIDTLVLLENHEAILMIDGKKLVLYNTREKTYRDLVLRDFLDVNRIRSAGTYVESLVSP